MYLCIDHLFKEGFGVNNNGPVSDVEVEVLCKLLTTIGGTLEKREKSKSTQQPSKIQTKFEELENIVNKNVGLNRRIRFMLLDLFELRKNNWTPRQKQEGPKTIGQIHADATKEREKDVTPSKEREKEKMVPSNRPGAQDVRMILSKKPQPTTWII